MNKKLTLNDRGQVRTIPYYVGLFSLDGNEFRKVLNIIFSKQYCYIPNTPHIIIYPNGY